MCGGDRRVAACMGGVRHFVGDVMKRMIDWLLEGVDRDEFMDVWLPIWLCAVVVCGLLVMALMLIV